MRSPGVVDEKPAAPIATVAEGVADGAIRRRSGPAAAVVLAAGIACFILGLLSIATAASGSVSDAFTLADSVGDVSGLSMATALAFFVTWGGLSIVWRRADPSLARVAAATAALVGLGLLGTFPPVFNAFGG